MTALTFRHRAPAIIIALSFLVHLTTAADRAGGAEVKPLRVVIAYGPGKKELAEFAKYLETHYHVTTSQVTADKAKKKSKKSEQFTPTPFNGLDALPGCDAILSNLYRTWAPPEQLAALKKHFLTKPVVGLRKAHHGFQNWLEADKEVFGVDYRGHYFGKTVTLRIVDEHQDDPLFQGLNPFLPAGGLYGHRDVAHDVDVLMVGGPEGKPPVLQTWKRVNAETGQRVFYTRYDPKDLSNEGVRDMVVRALFWAMEKEPEKYRRGGE